MNNDTCKMIENLSLLYRQYFKTNDTIVTIREEIEMLKMYMSIINIRFEGKLKFKIDVDKKLLDIPCLKMCLQPIVENAIKHGLRPLGYKGKIEVSLIDKEDGDLEFCIKDNGVGFSTSEISAKNRELLDWQNGVKDGVGLANVNSRLKLLYGDDYGVYIQQSSDSKKGSEVYIRFPKKQ